MIAADSSSVIAYLEGERAKDTDAIAQASASLELRLPPAVLVELMGRGASDAAYARMAEKATLLPLTEGYWLRARQTRRLILSKGLRARAVDAMVAQCCIDLDIPLIARDGDFRHFAQWCGLKLAV